MQWTKAKRDDGSILPRVIISDTNPAYRIARFTEGRIDTYRPSLGKEFLGQPCDTLKQAQQLCENHRAIMGP